LLTDKEEICSDLDGREEFRASLSAARMPLAHLGRAALDHHETSFANVTCLHGNGGGSAGIGSLELLDIFVVGHDANTWLMFVCQAGHRKRVLPRYEPGFSQTWLTCG